MDYKPTLNLPKTSFPMKAELATREPETVAFWDKNKVYNKLIVQNRDRPIFLMHDGPPYANGHIHFGHILNKVLKDVVVKYKNMTGWRSEFVPGWDCHGLPIELMAEQELGEKRTALDKLRFRSACKECASRFVSIQRDEFERVGVLADWEHPYLTMDPAYEATIAREFGKFVGAGLIYTGKRPIYWCPSCKTALAEAEVEYEDHTSPSIYVKFKLIANLAQSAIRNSKSEIFLVIWTTTPWTIPANLAIALHPKLKYSLVRVGSEIWILADELIPHVMEDLGIKDYKILGPISPNELEGKRCKHPFIDRDSIVILGEHVTQDAGTGCVHTAPGHGREDYEVGLRYGLHPFAPVDEAGCFTEDVAVPWLIGKFVEDANAPIVNELNKVGALLKEDKVAHSYPHCWRCKKPIVFRATEQWFVSLNKGSLRQNALKEIDKVKWIPHWGRDRIYGMIQTRPDWCISRQRSWGVPIIAIVCTNCGAKSTSSELVARVADNFAKHGSDWWFEADIKEIVPKGYKCPDCSATDHFGREEDIIDVWFESGVSYAAVCENRAGHHVPVDLYLEGSDQHRGWFHSALLTSVATRKSAPYKTVLTHGFVVDGEGRKYSKSAGNYIPPEKVLNKHGAEILRLWASAEDYRDDIRFSDEIITRLVEAYRKIRNTCRFLLGNLYDFDPTRDQTDKLLEIDRYALARLAALVERLRTAYDNYEFHVVYHALSEFCTVGLSAFYLDILKDRLYCEKADGPLRRAAQTAIWRIVDALVRLMAPVFSFTAEEVWQHTPNFKDKPVSVFLAGVSKVEDVYKDDELLKRWERFIAVRGEVTKALEVARKDKLIGNPLEAKVVLECDKETAGFLKSFGDGLADLFIVSQVEFKSGTPFNVTVLKADGSKCARCWKYSTTVGEDASYPEVCKRCKCVVDSLPRI